MDNQNETPAQEPEMVQVDNLSAQYFIGIVAGASHTKDQFGRNRPYLRVEPADGSAAVAVVGAPMGRINGLAAGMLVKMYVIPQKGNFNTYLGHELVDPKSLRNGAKPKALTSKAEATKAIATQTAAREAAGAKAELSV